MMVWQWIIIYLIAALIIYGIIYFLFLPRNINYNSTSSTSQISPTSSIQIIQTANNTVKGNFLTDSSGRALYIFDNDTEGVSNCVNACIGIWPPFSATLAPDNLPADISIIQRQDGSSQYAWKGKPLYFYASDKNVGDINGDGVGGIWHLVKP